MLFIIENSHKHWKAVPDEPEPPLIHWWWYRPRSADTETTAYALLTLVNMESSRNDKISEGLPVARWLSTQRNPWGGLGSTQVASRRVISTFVDLCGLKA